MLKTLGNEPQCIDPQLGKRLFGEICDAGLNGRPANISAELNEHLAACPYCGCLAWTWNAKSRGLVSMADEILASARAGDPNVLQRFDGREHIYFKRAAPRDQRGLLVRTDADGKITFIDETSIDRFA